MNIAYNPDRPELGTRKVPFAKELYIEREDFMEEPVKKYFRMFPGNEVRLMSAYYVTCTSVEKDENGNIIAVHGTYDPQTRGGDGTAVGRKVKGTIHWVAAPTCKKVTVRLIEDLIEEGKDVYNEEDGTMNLNEHSLITLKECPVEPQLAEAQAQDRFQFVRNGYFCVDNKLSAPGEPVFNRIVSLKTSFKL